MAALAHSHSASRATSRSAFALRPRLGQVVLFFLLPLLGYAHAFALAAPHDGQARWWLQMASMAALFILVDGSASARAAAWRSWWFATCWLAGVFWWLYISMHIYAGLNVVMTIVAIAALAGFLALYYALAGALYWRVRVQGFLGSALLFAAWWTLAELARGQLLTGFPWGAAGYAHVDGPLAWLARYVGVYGVGFVAVALAVLAALSVASIFAYIFGRMLSVGRLPVSSVRMLSAFIWLGAAAAALHWGGLWQKAEFAHQDARWAQNAPPAIALALLQGNIPQEEKFLPGKGIPDALQWYGTHMIRSQAPLVIAPETAIPLLKQDLPPGYWERVTANYRHGNQALLTGIPLGSFEQGYTNSVQGIKPASVAQGGAAQDAAAPMPASYTYDKAHLVPFGEFIPPAFRWFTNMMNIPLGDFNRGALAQPSFEWMGERFAPNICYEDLFGEELARRFAAPAQAPTVLVNFSNIGWFGDGVAVSQHLHISRMRTLELERPMVRATNTGATAVIDHRGVVQAIAPRAERYVLHADVRGLGQDGSAASITPFARWGSAYGLMPAWLTMLLIVIVTGMLWRRVPAVV